MIQILNPFAAGRKFQHLKSERRWILALLIVFVAGGLTLVGDALIQQKSQHLTQQYIEEMAQLPEAQLEAFENIQGFLAVIGIVFGFVFIVVFWVGKSVIFHIVARFLGGEQAEISSIIHLIAYTYLPFIIKGFIDLYRGLTYQAPSYAEYVQQLQLQQSDALLNFVREHNIFLIWALILMVIAVREQYNLSNGKASIAVLIPNALAWIVEIGLVFLGTQFMGG